MNLFQIALSFGAFVVLITCYGRLNDIGPDKVAAVWWFRRVGLLMLISACAMTFAAPVTTNVQYWLVLTRLLFVWGTAITLFTSPNQKPWWEFLMGTHRPHPDGLNWFERLRAEGRAVRNGFRTNPPADRRHAPGERRSGVPRRSGDDRRKST